MSFLLLEKRSTTSFLKVLVKPSSLIERMSESKSRWLLPERRDSLGSVEASSLRAWKWRLKGGVNKRHRRMSGSVIV